MQDARQDVARLQPTHDTLNIILKNTHFKDDILTADSQIQLRIDCTAGIPVLIFKFPEPYYDFLQIFNFTMLSGGNQEWLDKNPVIIKLVMSDTVITDRLSSLSFSLDPVESENLRISINEQKALSLSEFEKREKDVYSNVNKFLS